MNEIFDEQIKYVSDMINETNNEDIKNSLKNIAETLSRLKISINVDDNQEVAQERLNKIIGFIDDIIQKISLLDGPTDEEIVDGLEILKSNLKSLFATKHNNI